MSGFAWVTLATNDSYSLGALVLAHSLRQVGTAHQVAVLVTPGVTNAMRQKLAAVFNVVQEVNILDSKDEQNLRLLKRPELGITFTKLHCWRLTQFEKCVFMDADTLVMANSDELFEREEFSASPDVGWPDCFNSGVFVYRPSNETYDKLIDFAVQKGSFDGGDQGLLNLYFSDWAHKDISKHLPFIYNMCSTACYSYMPAFKQYGADVKIVHFVGPAKPWLQYFDTQTRKVHPSSGFQHMQIILQRWWDIFCSLIHPNLSPDMARSRPPAEHLAPSNPSYHHNPSVYSQNNNIRNYSVNNESLHRGKFREHVLVQNIRNIPFLEKEHATNGKTQEIESDVLSQKSYEQPDIQLDFHNVWDPWDEYDQNQYDEESSNLQEQTRNLNLEVANSQNHTCGDNNVAYDNSCDNIVNHIDIDIPRESDYANIQHPLTSTNLNHHDINYSEDKEVEVVVNNRNQETIQSQVRNHDNSAPSLNSPSSHYIQPDIYQNSIVESETQTNKQSPQVPLEISIHNLGIPALPIESESSSSTIPKETVSLHTTDYDDAESSGDSGLAGAFAQFTLGVKRTPSQDALENHLRRQAWEVGNIDYMGRDSFDNIWSKICETLAATPLEKPAESKPIEQTSSEASTQEKTTLSVEPAPKDVTGDAKEVPETAMKPETPQQIITIAEATAPDSKISVEAEPIISQEIKVEPHVVETLVETSKSEIPTETKPEPTPAQADVPQETKPEPQPAVIQELQAAIPMPAALGEPIMSGDKPPEIVATDAAKPDEPQKISAEPPKQEETPEVPKLEEPILPDIPTPATTAGVDITKIQDITKLEETSKPAELIKPEGTTVEVSSDAPKSEELPKKPSKVEDVVAKVEETPKITETHKAESESTAPPKVEEPSKAEDAPKVEDTTKLEEVSKTDEIKTEEIKTEEIKTEEIKTEEIKTDEIKTEEFKTEEIKTDLPQIQETAKTIDVSVDKDTKLEEAAKTEPEKVIAAQIVEEIPKVESKVDLPQESAKIEPVPEPEAAVKVEPVSQGEAPKTEGIGSDAKVEVTTKIEEKQTALDTKTESSKSQESASEAAKDSVAQTQKESQKTEETRKESPKTEEAPKEPTKIKKVSKDGKERKVKKVPKSDIKTDSPQEGATSSEAPAPEGESSTAPLTETPIPPPRKTTTTVKKVKAKKPSP